MYDIEVDGDSTHTSVWRPANLSVSDGAKSSDVGALFLISNRQQHPRWLVFASYDGPEGFTMECHVPIYDATRLIPPPPPPPPSDTNTNASACARRTSDSDSDIENDSDLDNSCNWFSVPPGGLELGHGYAPWIQGSRSCYWPAARALVILDDTGRGVANTQVFDCTNFWCTTNEFEPENVEKWVRKRLLPPVPKSTGDSAIPIALCCWNHSLPPLPAHIEHLQDMSVQQFILMAFTKSRSDRRLTDHLLYCMPGAAEWDTLPLPQTTASAASAGVHPSQKSAATAAAAADWLQVRSVQLCTCDGMPFLFINRKMPAAKTAATTAAAASDSSNPNSGCELWSYDTFTQVWSLHPLPAAFDAGALSNPALLGLNYF